MNATNDIFMVRNHHSYFTTFLRGRRDVDRRTENERERTREKERERERD